MIGANGAGKSTLINSISGIVYPVSGEIWFAGKFIIKKTVYCGQGRCLPGTRRTPGFCQPDSKKQPGNGRFLRNDKDEIARDIEYVFSVFPRLKERESQYAGCFSGGEQQMLAIGRGLLSKPKLMLLDQPSLVWRPCWCRSF